MRGIELMANRLIQPQSHPNALLTHLLPHPMNILVSNDDGYQAPGILALYETFKDMGHVMVVAPEQNNSAKSNALTLNSPLYVSQANAHTRFINGTPADCVHIALTGLLDFRPDLVISGINNGANMGDDTIYSGTVGAAMEAYLMGIPAIAFSQVKKGWQHLDEAALRAREIVDALISQGRLSRAPGQKVAPWLLNVNMPNLPRQEHQGFQICRLGRRHAAERVITQENPRGETMYWIGGAGAAKDDAQGTDFHATRAGFISITPLQVDLTEHESLSTWGQALQGQRLA
jgi:5'-nucleotidase